MRQKLTKLSQAAQNMEGSSTIQLDMKARELPGAINLTAGQVDSDLPQIFSDSICKAVKQPGINKYNDPQGMKELRKYFSNMLLEKGVKCCAEKIVITNSSKEAFDIAISVLINKGDEVVIMRPNWPTYEKTVKFYGGKPVFVKTDRKFHLDLERINKAITKKTKLLILNSPNNPTGAIYSRKEMEDLSALLSGKNIFVISDEAYNGIVFGENKDISISAVSEEMATKTLVLHSFSKSLAIQGLRIGFIAGPSEIIEAVKKRKSELSGNTNTLVQFALLDILQNKSSELFSTRSLILENVRKRKLVFCKALSEAGIDFIEPEGAIYMYLQIPKKEKSSFEFAEKLLKNGLAVSPGIIFGTEGYIRLSLSCSEEKITTVCEILKEFY